MPSYLTWFTFIRPWNTIHATGNSDWIKHLLAKNYILLFVFAMVTCGFSLMKEFENTATAKFALIPFALSGFFVLSALLKVIPWVMPIMKNDQKWSFSVPPESKLNILRYASKGTDKPIKEKIKDIFKNIFWMEYYIYPWDGGKQSSNDRSSSGSGTEAIAKSVLNTAIKRNPTAMAASIVAKKVAKKVEKVAKKAEKVSKKVKKIKKKK